MADDLVLLDDDFCKKNHIYWNPLYGEKDEELAKQEIWTNTLNYNRDKGLYVHGKIVEPLQTMAKSIRDALSKKSLNGGLYIVSAFRPVSLQEMLCPPNSYQASNHSRGNTVAGCVAIDGKPAIPIFDLINAKLGGENFSAPDLSDEQNGYITIYREAAEAVGFRFIEDKQWHIEYGKNDDFELIQGHDNLVLNQETSR